MRTRSPGTGSPSSSKCGRVVRGPEVPQEVNADAKSGDRNPGTGSPSSSKCGRVVRGPEVPQEVNADAKSGDRKSLKQ
ncbi:hypothetical protein CRG98_042880 [Punica granatum]|uniref:Uncharacterized protein n=1 Tax=Punica granatum TaxID=22663 RepID=A0A2I0HYG4_PUNGR|nr:hypothetical protein CRG98_042880 [Punica granatum]